MKKIFCRSTHMEWQFFIHPFSLIKYFQDIQRTPFHILSLITLILNHLPRFQLHHTYTHIKDTKLVSLLIFLNLEFKLKSISMKNRRKWILILFFVKYDVKQVGPYTSSQQLISTGQHIVEALLSNSQHLLYLNFFVVNDIFFDAKIRKDWHRLTQIFKKKRWRLTQI